MLKQIEGSQAVAEAVALCRPEVICAYPISPQTHIVEGLGKIVKSGRLPHCEFVNVESEHSALSVAIGSSAAGARSYTATASQGLLFMAEAVYNAGGLGLPIVMTIGNRAIGAPINIWNDHTDSMSVRDSDWIQLFAETNQEAADLHIQAFKIAEAISLPVMVCMDGFILTHAYEQVDIPEQEQVDQFLPAFQPRQKLDPENPYSIGAMVGPEAFTEVRYLSHLSHLKALDTIPEVAKEFKNTFGRNAGGLLHHYKIDDAETIIISMGSITGTIKDTIDILREEGKKIGVINICSFRPFPLQELDEKTKHARHIVVVEKSFAPVLGGILTSDVKAAIKNRIPVSTVIAGLGGRAITVKSLYALFMDAVQGKLKSLQFLDIQKDLVQQAIKDEQRDTSTSHVAQALQHDLKINTVS